MGWGGRAHGCLPKCRECRNAESRERMRREPHRNWEASYRERSRKFAFEPHIEHFTREDVLARYGDECSYCEGGAFENLDHYIPIEAGGPHTLENVRPSCRSCNMRKGRRDPRGTAFEDSGTYL